MPQGTHTLQEAVIAAPTFMADTGSLCATCTHSPRCSLHKQNREHVVECNEFDIINGFKKTRRPEILVFPKVKNRAIPDLRLGLCSTCLSIDTCTYEKPDTGVWHCEEYK